MASKLKFKIESSLDDRINKCHRCNQLIKKATVQIAEKVQVKLDDIFPCKFITQFNCIFFTKSKTEDALVLEWYDMDCFFKKMQPRSVNIFDGFYNLSNKDQNTVSKKISKNRFFVAVFLSEH